MSCQPWVSNNKLPSRPDTVPDITDVPHFSRLVHCSLEIHVSLSGPPLLIPGTSQHTGTPHQTKRSYLLVQPRKTTIAIVTLEMLVLLPV